MIASPEACCGCGACAAACPKECIRMAEGAYGFLCPKIDESVCVECGRCEQVCPVLAKSVPDGVVAARWVAAEEMELRNRSSSGGVFGLLAREVLSHDGVVCGAAWEEGCKRLAHKAVKDIEELDDIMRSKYVQSEVRREVYEAVQAALTEGKPALFCGTSCQVAGMRAYLGKLADSDRLLLVDVICHGAPTPLLWRKWLEYVSSSTGETITAVNFRCKDAGWRSFSVHYVAGTGDGVEKTCQKTVFRDDWYMGAFLRNASLRDSCFSCSAKRTAGSDITLGDYWGIELAHPEVNDDDRGVSAVLTNTDKGERALKAVLGRVKWGESSFAQIVDGNVPLVHSVKPDPVRNAFLQALSDGMPMEEMVRTWTFQTSMARKVAKKLKKALKKRLRR